MGQTVQLDAIFIALAVMMFVFFAIAILRCWSLSTTKRKFQM